MGIVAKQASRNAVYMLVGAIFGALNRVLILPIAFEDFTEGIGLIALLLSVALVLSQFLSLGANSIFINYLPKFNNSSKEHELLKRIITLCIVSSLLFGIGLLLGRHEFLQLLTPEDSELMDGNFVFLFILTLAITFYQVFTGFLQSKYKTVIVNILNDPFLKGTYLFLVIIYWHDIISFHFLLALLVGSYCLATTLAFFFSIREGFSISSKERLINKKEIIEYGLYSLLDKGAGTFVHQLDVLMISFILTLSSTGEYTIAFFIGSIVLIPQKSISSIANPIVSKEIANNNMSEVNKLLKDSSLSAVLVGGIIFSLVWISGAEIFKLLPDNFSNGYWVVFFIGMSRMVYMLGGISGGIILFSKYFRFNLILNVFLLVVTFITNLVFIPVYGIAGASLATFIAFLGFVIFRLWFVYVKFGIHPFSRSLFYLIAIQVIVISVLKSVDFKIHPALEIVINSVMFILLYYMLLRVFKVIPSLSSMFKLRKLTS